MKKNIILLLITMLNTINIHSQVLYHEDFNSYTIGNLCNNIALAGQGGWRCSSTVDSRIVWESGKDLYLLMENTDLTNTSTVQHNSVHNNIGEFWKLRDLKNNILKLEYEFNINFPYIGDYSFFQLINSPYFNEKYMLLFYHDNSATIHDLKSYHYSPPSLIIPNEWQKIVYYIDYNNYETYINLPSSNYATKIYNIDYTSNGLNLNQIQMGINSFLNITDKPALKIDNITISAIGSMPNLNVSALDVSKFAIYPNPSKDIINITNTNNILVNQVEVYDLSGKLILTKSFNNEIDVQINTETLYEGTYLLQLKTNEGICVKKFIKE